MEDLSSNESFWKSLAEILAYSQTFTLDLKNFKLSTSIATSVEDEGNGCFTILKKFFHNVQRKCKNDVGILLLLC